jgi:hypothetical protein
MREAHRDETPAPTPRRAHKTGSYGLTPAEVTTDLSLGDAALRVFTLLTLYADRDGVCWPSRKQLAEMKGVTPHAITVAINELVARGHVQRLAETTVGGARVRTRYRLRRPGESGWGEGKSLTQVEGKPLTQVEGKPLTQGGKSVTPERVSEVPVQGKSLTQVEGKSLTPNNTSTNTTNKTRESDQPPAAPPPVPVAAAPDEVAKVWAYYKARVQPTARACPTDKIRARLKKFTLAELQRGMDHFAANTWYMEHCAWRGGKWYFATNDRVEGFLNMPPRPAEGATADGRRDGGAQRPPAAANRWVAASNAAGWITDDTNPFEAYRETTLGVSRP